MRVLKKLNENSISVLKNLAIVKKLLSLLEIILFL